MNNLEGLFKHLLLDMYSAEHQISDALPDMIEKASDPDLKDGFEQHRKETEDQIGKLERVCDMLGYDQKQEECEAMEELLEEGDDMAEEMEEGPVRDSALIAAAQKVEHYEIASYGTLCAIAKKLGYDEAEKILHDILEQEKDTDEKLTRLADGIEDQAMREAA